MTLVWTQYGPVPRDVLEPRDEISETEGSRSFATIWFLNQPIVIKYCPIGTMHSELPFIRVDRVSGGGIAMPFSFPENMEVRMLDGSKRRIKEDEEVNLVAGEFMRRSCAAEMFMPSAMGGQQAKV